jgi:hypothetical protein
MAYSQRIRPSRGALRSPDDPPLKGSSRVSDAAARWADNLSQKSAWSRSEPPKTSAFFAAAPQPLLAREPFERRGRGGRSIRVPRPAPAILPRRRLPPTPAAARKRTLRKACAAGEQALQAGADPGKASHRTHPSPCSYPRCCTMRRSSGTSPGRKSVDPSRLHSCLDFHFEPAPRMKSTRGLLGLSCAALYVR